MGLIVPYRETILHALIGCTIHNTQYTNYTQNSIIDIHHKLVVVVIPRWSIILDSVRIQNQDHSSMKPLSAHLFSISSNPILNESLTRIVIS